MLLSLTVLCLIFFRVILSCLLETLYPLYDLITSISIVFQHWDWPCITALTGRRMSSVRTRITRSCRTSPPSPPRRANASSCLAGGASCAARTTSETLSWLSPGACPVVRHAVMLGVIFLSLSLSSYYCTGSNHLLSTLSKVEFIHYESQHPMQNIAHALINKQIAN